VPTPTFICGAECGNTLPGTLIPGTEKHWDAKQGTPSIDSTIAHAGGYSFLHSTSASVSFLEKTFTLTDGVFRAYVYLQTLPPSTDIRNPIVGFAVTGGLNYAVGYDPATGLWGATAGTALSLLTGPPAVAGRWYRIEGKASVGASPHTIDWSVDGVPQTQVTRAATATAFIAFRHGCSFQTTNPTNYIVNVDDVTLSETLADYPLGPGLVAGLHLRADGTHNMSAVTDFKVNNTTNMSSINPTDTWTHLVGLMDNITDFLAASGVSAGEYLEWLLESMPDALVINGVEFVMSCHSAGTAANKATLRMIDGATTIDVFTDLDISNAALSLFSTTMLTAPSGGAWTKAKLDALKLRWGSSWTAVDISPVPFIDGVRLEVDYVPLPTQPLVRLQAVPRAAFY
jgi:hypothetical protein